MRNTTAIREFEKVWTIDHNPRPGIELVGNSNIVPPTQRRWLSYVAPDRRQLELPVNDN
jgi:hypothetical protein